MKDVELFSAKTLSWRIPFEEDGKGWSLVISRVQGTLEQGDLIKFSLHWNSKEKVTKQVEGGVAEFRAMFRELGA